MDYRQTPAIFIADATGLDFLNSEATPGGEAIDWISDGEGLLAWLSQAGLVPAEVLETMRNRYAPAELNEAAKKARELRSWFKDFARKRKGRPLVAEDLHELEPLNQLLRRDAQHREIVPKAADGGTTFELRVDRCWHSAESLLMPIAEALARLVCEEDFTHVKACEGPRCTLMFVDHTRRHARRWCSMALCGNRAKVAAHRKRIKEQRSD
ncbi:putative RNA-binding Zn ribbon-like protein [Chromobacterium alkanivorans]|uniref:CGNR zinc finger domain-containing protein n=1 Tax=Chromobacterium alkanivorans TaxID=1071719 RepID=UPI002168B7F5|nr:ABATE domain-containing protein [Chromobacterium alkanivorans]MCS3806865.1 putative RNA-binding Zn ribbon-like protein [Chromobacterium alkanivorans]MCS3821167.1 putative RNA-binding Zn ribbon-like protein [Chromobacterium alkanivorans]MCS3876202.1 putative RNA-binding Zn ribbon-like protein [Chromobacterium alkanivorans]